MSLILSGTDGLSDVDGSAATPAIRGTDANTGIYFPAANQLALATDGTLALLVDATQNLVLGTAAKNFTFQQTTAAGANSTSYPGYIAFTGFGWNTSLGSSPLGVRLAAGGNYTPDLGQVAPGLSISTQNTNGSMTQRMLLNGYGIGLGTGTYPISGTGIKFPATLDASNDANTLDDYEEGTFTPTVTFDATNCAVGTATGTYTKIGNVVFFACRAESVTKTGTGYLYLRGLPFTVSATANQNRYCQQLVRWTGINPSAIIIGLAEVGQTYLTFQNFTTTGGYSGGTVDSQCSASFSIYGVSGFYYTA